MSLASRFGAGKGDPAAFGYAVVGLGHIAEYFMDALEASPACGVTALVSGNPAKAAKLAAKYRVRQVLSYTEFDRIRDSPLIDAVYLALPVSMHREYTERAAAAGKHVLCEKPMAPTADDARAMITACQTAGVRLSIAYRCPFDGTHQRAREIVRSGALGDRLRIDSGFGFRLDPGWRTDPALAGGGSLFDVGIYPLNASRYLLGEEPNGVRDSRATCDANGLEQAINWTSTFPSGAEAACRSSYRELIRDTLRVSGSRGSLLLAPAFSHREQLRLQGQYTDATTGKTVKIDEKTPRGAPSHFTLEAEHLAAVVREGLSPITPGEDGLADMIAMEAIYRAAGVPVTP